MYPRNDATPEPVAIGAVVQISDGEVQLSDCSVRIKPTGVAEGNGLGTIAYSTDGIVIYTPTQAETNHTSFILIAAKTGCIPVSVTVVTTELSTAGTGPFLVEITVDDGTDPLVGVDVRLLEGINSATDTTIAGGIANLSVGAATWWVLLAKDGYSFTPVQLVVDGDETVTYSMTLVVVPPAGVAGKTNAFFYTINEPGVVPNVAIEATLVSAPAGTGSIFIGKTIRGSSNGAGLFQWEAFVDSTYQVKIGNKIFQITIPADAADPYEVTNQLVCVNC